jgi:hypothetical protein
VRLTERQSLSALCGGKPQIMLLQFSLWLIGIRPGLQAFGG